MSHCLTPRSEQKSLFCMTICSPCVTKLLFNPLEHVPPSNTPSLNCMNLFNWNIFFCYYHFTIMHTLAYHLAKRAVALVLPLPDPTIPEQHEKCCILCKKPPEWKLNSMHHLRCRLHHYYKPKADCILLNRRE